MQMRSGVAAFSGVTEFPLQLSGSGIDGVEVTVVAAEVNEAVSNGG